MSTGKVLPRPDADTRPYWAAAARGELILQYCAQCGKPRFYPRLLCPSCHSEEHEWRPATGAGVIYSFSVVHRAPLPEFQADVPYVVALIDLVDGVRMFANVLAEPTSVRIGQRVKVTFRRETDEIGIPEFVLDEEGSVAP
jgi:uncharacterized OB-fold protein